MTGLNGELKLTDLPTFPGNEGWVPHGPDFLWRLVALIHSMRLSLMKGAHADLSSTAWQEIGVKPAFGLEWGTTALDTPFFAIPRSSRPADGVLRFPASRQAACSLGSVGLPVAS